MANEIDKLLRAKFMNRQDAASLVGQWKADGNSIVFTNGCFDLLHPGHLNYLMEAAGLGDKLVLGLNSDSSVKRLKGESRPINDEYTRAAVLASMYFIDLVVPFGEDTPLSLVQLIVPDILVKGGDYSPDEIVGAKEVISNGGKVEVLQFLDGYSSTGLIEKIKKM